MWVDQELKTLRDHSCVNEVQHCLWHLYTLMRHSKQTATLLLILLLTFLGIQLPAQNNGHATFWWGQRSQCSSGHALTDKW